MVSLSPTPETETELDDLLALPTERLIAFFRGLEGDLLILGVGGKMGHTVAAMAVRAVIASGRARRVIGVSRFTDSESRQRLEKAGVETLACDLLDPDALSRLPLCPNVIFMAGRKFGTGGSEPLTWAMNTIVPGNIARHFAGSRIVAFSTGCVYPFVSADSGGSLETDPPGPTGEYAQSCLGRERIFEHYSRSQGTPVCLYRLNYAIDLRYGVLHDIAWRIWEGQPVDLTMGLFNCIWQGDAAERALLCLGIADSPAVPLNVTGPEALSTRTVAEQLARLLASPVYFAGEPGPTAWLANACESTRRFGPPRIDPDPMIRWQAEWIRRGGRSLNKPSHFEVKSGKF
ncbi:NAD(P)-dependent oxidoreductase [bacterium]|nr:NAD(P)-dependent oxidoreductase [bacterium]